MPTRRDAQITIRLSAEDRDALQAAADAADEPISQTARRAIRAFLGLGLAALAILLTACGAEQPATSPVAERTAVVGTPVAETPSVAVSEPVVIPTEVIRLGVDQVLRIDGLIVGRIKIQSYDPADNGVAVEVNSAAAPLVVDPAAFTLTNADGTEITGVASSAAWDVDLAANDQTIGQVRFVGATVPVTITYAPEGAEPLLWSF